MTTRYERIKLQRRMQRRIRMVVEERRMSLANPLPAEPSTDPETTMEIPPMAGLRPAPLAVSPLRAIGRVTISPA